MMFKVRAFNSRHEAHVANLGTMPRELEDGRWITPDPDGEAIDVPQIGPEESMAKMLKVELQEWAEDLGLSTSGTKAQISDRIRRGRD